MTNIEIGERIKFARDLRGTTLDDIAKKVGVAKSTVQRYESGKIKNIKLPVVESIATALNVNPSWIIGKSDNMELPKQKNPEIVMYYEKLNEIGKKEAVKRVKELTFLPEYSLTYNADIEMACENQLIPYSFFSNVNDAKEFIQEHKAAAFTGMNDINDETIIEMANAIKSNTLDKEKNLNESK